MSRPEEADVDISLDSNGPIVRRWLTPSTVLLLVQVALFVLVSALIILQIFGLFKAQIDNTTVALLVILLGVTLLHRIQLINLGLGDASFGLEMSKVANEAEWENMPERAKEIRSRSDKINREILEVYDSVFTKLSDAPLEALRELRRRLRGLLSSVCGYDNNGQTGALGEPDVRPDGGAQESENDKERSSADPRRFSGIDLDVIHEILYIVDISIYAYKRKDIKTSEVQSVLELGMTAITLLQAERESSADRVDQMEWDESPAETEWEESSAETEWDVSTTVKHARDRFDESDEITAAEFVSAILDVHGYHPDYAGGRFTDWSADEVDNNTKTADKWLAEVQTLFDPAYSRDPEFTRPMLHGKLVILGLSILDENLGRELQSSDILPALEDEIEDFIPIEELLTERGRKLRHSID